MNSYPIEWRRMESRMKNWRTLHYYTENILYTLYVLLNWKYVHNVFTILPPNFQSLFKASPISPSDVHPSSNPKQLMLSGVSLLAVSNVNNPVGLVGLLYVMWSAHFFVTHIQTEKISSWKGPTVHVCCFMLARASTKTFVSRIHIR